jgi:hypothetical protein
MRFSVVVPNTIHVAALTQPWECGLTGRDIARVAGATSTISIGSMVTILPLHNPVIAAKSIATLNCGTATRPRMTANSSDSVTSRSAQADSEAPPSDLDGRRCRRRAPQPGYDGRPFALFFGLASLNIGVAHEINGDPHSQFGQNAQQVIDNCNMLAGLGVTDTWVNPPPLADFSAYLDHLHWVAEEVMPKAG